MANGDSRKFYEFFAGGGMARAGLAGRECIFANDFSNLKATTYRQNYPGDDMVENDVWKLDALPAGGGLVWASSPCQDLSLAGKRAGLSGERSAAFWGFWKKIEELGTASELPRIIAIENVTGLLSSHEGQDFKAICDALVKLNYSVGAVEIDAALFVPQSRQRVFIVGVQGNVPAQLIAKEPSKTFHTAAVRGAYARLCESTRQRWVWWNLPVPKKREVSLADILEKVSALEWHAPDMTERLIGMMSDEQVKKLKAIQKSKTLTYGTGFRRMREVNGVKMQRVELRFDGVAGCLRTPRGGSSSQFVVEINGSNVKTRRLTKTECALLMGLDKDYQLPKPWTAAMAVLGDGVVVNVVRFLSENLFDKLEATTAGAGFRGWQEEASVISAASASRKSHS